MKLTNLCNLAAMGAACVLGAPQLTVYLAAGPAPQLTANIAKAAASRMLAEAGVEVEWKSGVPHRGSSDPGCSSESHLTLAVSFDSDGRRRSRQDAMAYARPYDSRVTSIVVLYERVAEWFPKDPSRAGTLLAHVLVHEITHVLQGVNRHSDEGIMKAHWSGQEIRGLASRSMPFTSNDVELIQHGFTARIARACSQQTTISAAR